MKAVMLSKKEIEYANYHLHDGLETTLAGLNQLLEAQLITLQEHDELMQKAINRHLKLWRAFTNTLVQKTVCIFFAALFVVMQVNGDDVQMRKPTRGRRRSELSITDYYDNDKS